MWDNTDQYSSRILTHIQNVCNLRVTIHLLLEVVLSYAVKYIKDLFALISFLTVLFQGKYITSCSIPCYLAMHRENVSSVLTAKPWINLHICATFPGFMKT